MSDNYTDEMKQSTGILWGGHVAEIPLPHIRKWPGHSTKRPVSVAIQVYAVGVHYSANVKEEDNPIWNPLTQAQANPTWKEIQRPESEYGKQVVGWQASWDDVEGKGKQFFSDRCLSRHWVIRWLEEILAKHFSPETHEIHGWSSNLLKEIRWGGYLKEGD